MSDLRPLLQLGPTELFSLRSVMTGALGRKLVMFVEVRDASILLSVSSLAELQAVWKTTAPTRITLTQLSQILNSVGAGMKLVSVDFQRLGISGTAESFLKVPTLRITDKTFDGAKAVAGGIAGLGGVLMGIGFGIPTQASPYFIGIGAGAMVAGFESQVLLGMYEMINDSAGSAIVIPETTVVGIPEITVPPVIIGASPPNFTPQDIFDAPLVDPNDPNAVPDPRPDPGPPVPVQDC